MTDYRSLLPYCQTDLQTEAIAAMDKYGSQRKAARALGKTRSSVYHHHRAVQKHAARQGYSPDHDMTRPVPDGYHVRGVSTMYDRDGEVTAQWVKSQIDAEAAADRLKEIFQAMMEGVKPYKPVAGSKKPKTGDLMNVHILTDYHLGMKAWREECGESWDTNIAEKMLTDWFAYAVREAPAAGTGVLAQLGDFLHWDGLDAVTPASKHLLDADTRFQKVVRVAIRSIRQIITLMLRKYDKVHIIMADANHDPAGSAWLREMFAAFYADDPRVTVDNSADTYYCLEFGDTSVFFHHGHKRKPTAIDDVMAAKFREVFGRTKHSYIHLGHLHHHFAVETNLMEEVEQHRTMAAKDAYSSRGGWLASRGAWVISYHRQHGEIGRFQVRPGML